MSKYTFLEVSTLFFPKLRYVGVIMWLDLDSVSKNLQEIMD